MLKCEKCGAEVEEGASHCPQCGSPLPMKKADIVVVKGEKEMNKESDNFGGLKVAGTLAVAILGDVAGLAGLAAAGVQDLNVICILFAATCSIIGMSLSSAAFPQTEWKKLALGSFVVSIVAFGLAVVALIAALAVGGFR